MKRCLLPLVLACGCASEARLPASYFAETSEVLAPGKVAVTAVGGAAQIDGAGYGAGARARVGVGGGTEVGVEASSSELHTDNYCGIDDCTDTHSKVASHGAMLSVKTRFRGAAVVAGFGATRHDLAGGDDDPSADLSGTSLDASIGLVGDRPLDRDGAIYFGLRLDGAFPVGANPMSVDPLFSAYGALGYTTTTAPLRVFAEVGPRYAFLASSYGLGELALQGVVGVRLVL